jgi:hypothetical protein
VTHTNSTPALAFGKKFTTNIAFTLASSKQKNPEPGEKS